MSDAPGAVLAVETRRALDDLLEGVEVGPGQAGPLVEALTGLLLRTLVACYARHRGLGSPPGESGAPLGAFWKEHEDLLVTPESRRVVEASGIPPRRLADVAERVQALPSLAAAELGLEDLGRVYEELQSTSARRRRGSHFTPPAMAEQVVRLALAPLMGGTRVPRVCDPAMGAGAFLLAVARVLGDTPATRAEIAKTSLYGLDRDSIAVDLCRLSLWLDAGAADDVMPALRQHLRHGDALVGRVRPGEPPAPELPTPAFDWGDAHPEVFSSGGGFDAVVGNPPWVAYAGRAAQPLSDPMRAHYRDRYRAFAGYRTLHGLFVERATELVRQGGRLGLVVPTSLSDLAGYQPTRDAHDARAEVDDELPDFGADAFEGVFQPAMALLSTRRARDVEPSSRTWAISRDDLDEPAKQLLARLSALPPLAKEVFGERGLQTQGADVQHIRKLPGPEPPYAVPIREGTDVTEYCSARPRKYLDPSAVRARLRPESEWKSVSLYLRQTARYPVVSRADGLAFRNSVLAGFADDATACVLLAYLNSTPIRWLHYTRHRDARQGMPQVKIGHLRSIPAPPAAVRSELEVWGRRLGERNDGVRDAERTAIDDLVMRGFDLDENERAAIEAFRASGIR